MITAKGAREVEENVIRQLTVAIDAMEDAQNDARVIGLYAELVCIEQTRILKSERERIMRNRYVQDSEVEWYNDSDVRDNDTQADYERRKKDEI